MAKKIGESVSGHIRFTEGKPVKVKAYKRKIRGPGSPKAFRKKYQVTYFRDSNTGRVLPEREYKPI